MAKKKSKPNLILTELFLVKADWSRTFMGEIRREIDNNGNPIVLGKVVVKEGHIWALSKSQKELMKIMDELCIMKLDYGLHENGGRMIEFFNVDFSIN